MSDPFIGEIKIVGFNFPPRGWALCDGQILAIASHTALFSLLGTTFGGDGRITFGLPDLRGRVPVGVGNGPGLSPITWGEKSGQNTVTLTTNEIPSHSHTGTVKVTDANAGDDKARNGGFGKNAGSNIYAADPTYTQNNLMSVGNVAVNNTGGGQAHNNMQPFLGLFCCIALVGIFPSRN